MNLIAMKDYLSKLLENFAVVIDLEMTILNVDPFERIAWTGDFFYRKVIKPMKKLMRGGRKVIRIRSSRREKRLLQLIQVNIWHLVNDCAIIRAVLTIL